MIACLKQTSSEIDSDSDSYADDDDKDDYDANANDDDDDDDDDNNDGDDDNDDDDDDGDDVDGSQKIIVSHRITLASHHLIIISSYQHHLYHNITYTISMIYVTKYLLLLQ